MNAPARSCALAVALAGASWSLAPRAQPVQASAAPAAPVTSAAPPSSAAPAPQGDGTCVERIPSGKERPRITEKFAPNAISGHAHLLEVVIEHGPGETVLPTGFRLEPGSTETRAFEATGFVFPDPAGPSAPEVIRTQRGDRATTTVKLEFVPLPKKPGRNSLVLPRLPISIARASGEIMTICTEPHPVTVEDPIANEPDPKPKSNPPPRRQLEEWTLAKQLTIAALIALVVGALAAFLIQRWIRRPRPAPPAPPPRPPWEVAMEGLFDTRHAGLLDTGRQAEFYDRVADVIRRYLGDRYGYDGLESTTREALASLRRVAVPMDVLVQIQQFMQDADLVKFARRTPSNAECETALLAAERIIGATKPVELVPQEPPRQAAPEAVP